MGLRAAACGSAGRVAWVIQAGRVAQVTKASSGWHRRDKVATERDTAVILAGGTPVTLTGRPPVTLAGGTGGRGGRRRCGTLVETEVCHAA
jgi:hypothetical protein